MATNKKRRIGHSTKRAPRSRRRNKGHFVDRTRLPVRFPTHAHPPLFWESLGRAVASFAFLEEQLKRAVFALTGSVPATADISISDVEKWGELLERTLVSALSQNIDTFAKHAKKHPEFRGARKFDSFVEQLRKATKIRNAICHGSWDKPDANGASRPFYFTGKPGKQVVPFETAAVTVAWLDQQQAHACELACEVIDTVTRMGYQFPGSNSPGRPLTTI